MWGVEKEKEKQERERIYFKFLMNVENYSVRCYELFYPYFFCFLLKSYFL